MAIRRHLRSVSHENGPHTLDKDDPDMAARAIRIASSRTAKIAFVAVGAVGLAALGLAIFGPKRFQREILSPVRDAVGDRAERLWSDSSGLRDQIGQLFNRAGSPAGREKLARNFQSWIGHFRAG